MPRPPNYRQDKKRREEAQKRRNQEEQIRKVERKNKNGLCEPDAPSAALRADGHPPAGTADPTSETSPRD